MKRLIGGSRVRTGSGAALAAIALVLTLAGAASAPGLPAAAASAPGGSCGAFRGARQLPGADGVTPAAWSGDGLTIPACGPIPNDGGPATPVYPYPGALWTPGYQCVEFSERYLYYRYGVTMGIPTNGDEVAAHYSARYPRLFMIIRNGTPHRAPVAGDVLSMSTVPGFDSAGGGHTAVVQSSDVSGTGDGTVTIVEQNAVAAGVEVLPVTDWSVRYGGFGYIEWLTTAGLIITTPALPAAWVSRPYSATLTAAGRPGPYQWALISGPLPAGLSLSATGTLSGTVTAATASGGGETGDWPVTVRVTDARGATATASLQLSVTGSPEVFSYDAAAGALREADWTSTGWHFTTVDGTGSALPGHTSGNVGAAVSAVGIAGQPTVFYSDTTTGSLRVASRSGGRWQLATLDGPGATTAGHTRDHVGSAVSAVVAGGQPQVFYSDETTHSVRYAALTAAGWRLETLDGPGSVLYQHTWHHVGAALSALVLDGMPEVFYADTSAGALHRAWWTGTRWLFLTIDGAPSLLPGHTTSQVGSAVSVAVLRGMVQVFYADTTTGSLRQAQLTGAGWRFQTLDGAGSSLPGHTAGRVGTAVAVTQMSGGTQVYYDDATAHTLRHAWWTPSGWRFETLDGAGSVIAGHDTDWAGPAVSVTEMISGPQVYYDDATAHALRHAWWTPSGWRFEILDGPGSALPGHTGDPLGPAVAVTLH